MSTPPVIAVVAFDRISPFHLSVPCVVFGENLPGLPHFDLRVCGAEGRRLTTTAGFQVVVEHGLEALEGADTVIVPSWRDPEEPPPRELLVAIAAAEARGARIVGLCLGAYVVAEAGLLEGRRATTHWAFAEHFARCYPGVALEPDVLYVDDGPIVTSAGTAAGIDRCLQMVREGYGAESANRMARMLVVPPHRQGGQAQFIEQPLPSSAGDSRLAELIEWVRGDLSRPYTLDTLAERALMSRRTFTRHFRKLTGTTVGEWLLNERLALCQRLLEGSERSIEQVALEAGFGSVVSMRQHFRRVFGVSPSAWRRTFRGALI